MDMNVIFTLAVNYDGLPVVVKPVERTDKSFMF